MTRSRVMGSIVTARCGGWVWKGFDAAADTAGIAGGASAEFFARERHRQDAGIPKRACVPSGIVIPANTGTQRLQTFSHESPGSPPSRG
ncbi:hypothetical protein [Lysobacter gummosus]|uniref:hypothetical protein n=1 Tax=Lysobacter gummosus TaxID=262324 RepID=UPI003645753C